MVSSALICTFFALHTYYFSTTEIHHNPETEALEITVRMFTDDLERAAGGKEFQEFRLGGEDEHPEADGRIHSYLQQHLRLQEGERRLALMWVGKEVEVDVTWCYLEVLGMPAVDSLTVANDIMLRMFDTQTNEVHLTGCGKTQSLVCNRQQSTGSFRP